MLCVRDCISVLARRSGTSSSRASASRIVFCILLDSACTPSRVLSAHPPPQSPTRCLSICASVLRCDLSDPPALPHVSPCPIGAIIVDRLTGLPFHSSRAPACENLTAAVLHLLQVFFLPKDQGISTRACFLQYVLLPVQLFCVCNSLLRPACLNTIKCPDSIIQPTFPTSCLDQVFCIWKCRDRRRLECISDQR